MKTPLLTIAGSLAIGLANKAKKASANIKHNIFNPSKIISRTSQYHKLNECNKGFKDGTLVGAEIIGSSLNTDIGFDPGLVDLLEDKSINAIITSPPYLGVINYNKNNPAEVGGKTSNKEKYVQNLVSLFVNLKNKLKDDGTLWVNLGKSNKNSDIYILFNAAMMVNGWVQVQEIVWAKSNPLPKPVSKGPGSPKFSTDTEVIFVYAKKKAVKEKTYKMYCLLTPTTSDKKYKMTKTRGYCGSFISQEMEKPKKVKPWRLMGSLWSTGNVKPVKDRKGNLAIFDKRFGNTPFNIYRSQFDVYTHSAVMNPIIVRNCIWAATKPGDVILDPFSGTGTVTNIAKMMGRIGIGFELGSIHAIMAVVGKDYVYSENWRKAKIRDERNKSDRTTEPLPDKHKDYTMNLVPLGKSSIYLRRGNTPFKTELIDFEGVRFSYNPLWKHIEINEKDIRIRKKVKETIYRLLALFEDNDGEGE